MSETKAARTRRQFSKPLRTDRGNCAGGRLSPARAAHAAGDDTIRVALVGCGGRGAGAATQCLNVPDRLKLVAVADAFQDAAERAVQLVRQQHPDKVDVPHDRIFAGFDAYQRAIDCGVDLVLLCSPPGFRPLHYRAAIAGRQARVHGKARVRRRARLSLRDGDEQDG